MSRQNCLNMLISVRISYLSTASNNVWSVQNSHLKLLSNKSVWSYSLVVLDLLLLRMVIKILTIILTRLKRLMVWNLIPSTMKVLNSSALSVSSRSLSASLSMALQMIKLKHFRWILSASSKITMSERTLNPEDVSNAGVLLILLMLSGTTMSKNCSKKCAKLSSSMQSFESTLKICLCSSSTASIFLEG